ncbi:MAG: hypothetical protein ACRDXX_17300 [Stackebrandtia sp.]
MITYAQLIDMDMSKLSTAAETAGSLSSTLSGRASALQAAAAIPAGMWAGVDAAAAGGLILSQAPPLFDASDAFSRGQAVMEDLVDGLEAAKEHLQGAHDLVAGTGITIHGDGTVTTPAVDSVNLAEHNAVLAQQARDVIDEALAMADEADQEAAAALDSDDDSVVPDFLKDTFHPGLNMDKEGNLSLNLGESEHSIGIEGPSHEMGPFGFNTGGVGLNDNPYPGISLDRWPPKVSLPFMEFGGPSVNVDLVEVRDGLKGAAEVLNDIPWRNPLDDLPFGDKPW